MPGARVPHIVLPDGRTLYDALGKDYTLLRFDRSVDAGPLLRAAEAAGLPLELLDIDAPEGRALYSQKLLICRSDQHIAWRGNGVPDDCAAIVERLAGRDGAAFERCRRAHKVPVADAPAKVN